jgi:hypothetical protein
MIGETENDIINRICRDCSDHPTVREYIEKARKPKAVRHEVEHLIKQIKEIGGKN